MLSVEIPGGQANGNSAGYTLPSEWQLSELSRVAEKPQYGYTASAAQDRIGPKFLRVTDIQNGSVNWSKVPYVACADAEFSKYRLESGDILVARIGTTTGKTFYVRECPAAIFASYLIRLRTNSLLLPEFLAFWTSSRDYWDQVNAAKGGRLKQGINIPFLSHLILPVPPLDEQRRIARVLSTIQRAIEAEDKVITSARELKRSLMKHLFTYGPVPVTEASRVPLKETEIGPAPEHWEVARLGQLCHRPQYGYTSSASVRRVGPHLLRITDIQDGGVRWASVPFCKPSDRAFEAYRLAPDDILIARIGATTGKTFLVKSCPEAMFASYLIRIRVKTELGAAFLKYWTDSLMYWNQINGAKGGRLKQGINIPVLTSLLIAKPSPREQGSIAKTLCSVEQKIEVEQKRKTALQALFKSMLRHLMTGKIRV